MGKFVHIPSGNIVSVEDGKQLSSMLFKPLEEEPAKAKPKKKAAKAAKAAAEAEAVPDETEELEQGEEGKLSSAEW